MSRTSADWGFPNEATPVGSGPYYAVRFSPAHLRAQNAIILAWYRKIRAIAHSPSDPGIARLQLDWWHAELQRTFEERRPQHPMTVAMASERMADGVADPMHALLSATEQAIRKPVLVDVTAFREDCRASGGRLFEMLCRLEPASAYNTDRSIALGTYWEAVERLSRLPDWPAQVTAQIDPRQTSGLPTHDRRRHCEALLQYPDQGTRIRHEEVPELARRLVAVAQGLHRRLDRRGFAEADRPLDRAPIAHLWTAWRCRSALRGLT
jgi:phytoene synthase